MSVSQDAAGLASQSLSDQISLQDKFREAIVRSQTYLPRELWDQVKALISPEALALMVSVTGAWAISHFFGVGEIADGVLLVAGALVLGSSAFEVGKELLAFGNDVRSAKTTGDLDAAGRHFARAVVLGGITVVTAMFFKSRPKTFDEPIFDAVRVPPPPRPPPEMFYKPTVTVARIPQPNPSTMTFGVTDMFGNITIDARLTPGRQLEVLWHERVHQLLTPKLYFLRNIRVKAAMEGYNRSYLLRYLEEALAESYSQLRSRGLGGVVTGIKFPVRNGYVTIAAMTKEIKGIVLGTVTIAGSAYRVYFTSGRTDSTTR